jgi:plasmid maintenance system antidote protein VapI
MTSKYELVHGYIKLAGYSLDEAAEALGMTRRTLENKIKGCSDFTLSEARRLKEITGRSIDELFVVKKDANTQQINNEREEN